MDDILGKLFESQALTREEANRLMHAIASRELNEARMAAVLAAYVMRSANLEELLGFRDALLELAVRINIFDGETLDVCGTGGDKKNTFNISTLTAFVVAGAGIPVTKHGNYGVSSASGSSNVMEYLGYRFSSDKDKLLKEMEQAGICFMHAPLFHPALKAIGGIRKQLGVKTFFNILGPLVNPASPRFQLSGVFNIEAGRVYSYLLQRENKQFSVVYSLDGYDEVSLTADVKIFSRNGENLLSPADFGFEIIDGSLLQAGSTVQEAAGAFIEILENKSTEPRKQVVMANAALAIQCYRGNISLKEAVDEARETLESGRAMACFKTLLAMQS